LSATASSLRQQQMTNMVYDAIVIGGGPAGLTAAVYLARFRRSVLLVDAGHSRLASIPRSHNYPGFPDGVPGNCLLTRLRRQAERYGIDFVTAHVDRLQRSDRGFGVFWAGGSAWALQVMMATGVSDVAPDMPYLAEALRTGLLRYCPVCDAYEIIGHAIGVICASSSGLAEARYLRHFTDRISVFRQDDRVHFTAEERAEMLRAGITVAEEPVASVRQSMGRAIVRHGERVTSCHAVYAALGLRIHSGLATPLGAATDDSGYLIVNPHHETTVEGLYAAGDVTAGLNQIAVATGGSAIASSAMHLALGTVRRR
jgi:thioredoxin reductase (NADPH)